METFTVDQVTNLFRKEILDTLVTFTYYRSWNVAATLTLGFERHLHALAPNNAHLVPINAKRVGGS